MPLRLRQGAAGPGPPSPTRWKAGPGQGRARHENPKKTTESQSKLKERLAVIETAKKNITQLSPSIVSRQAILANKQQRGAYGQGRREAIIEDALPKGAYSFQATLSNNMRPDCLIHLPTAPDLVIDAKYPLEAFEALREAQDESEKKQAMARVRSDVGAHIRSIAERYFIAGETQDTALMFVPAASLYADPHASFPDIIPQASRARISIV